MSDGTVLSAERLRAAFYAPTAGGQSGAAEEMRRLRAVERAVLEALPDAATEAQANADLCARLMALEGDNEALRARIAELERERGDAQHTAETYKLVLDCALEEIPTAPDECRAYIELPGYIEQLRTERDAARRELEEAREDTARLDWLGAPDDVGGRWARVWRTWNGEEPLRAALDRAREGEP